MLTLFIKLIPIEGDVDMETNPYITATGTVTSFDAENHTFAMTPNQYMGRSLPCPLIPHGIHVESIWNPCCSTWNLPIPHGICFG